MPRLAFVAVSLLLAAGAHGDFRRYTFDTDGDYLAQASFHGPWAALMARHAQDRPLLDACIADKANCPGYLKGFRYIVTKGRKLDRYRQLTLVNRFVNRHVAIHQNERRPRGDDGWKTLTAFLREGGDCEDFAIAKYFMLRELGFEAKDLRVVITWDREARAYHALLAVNTQPRAVLLEIDDTMRTGSGQNEYRFLYSINENSVWDHMAHAGMKRLPRW